MGSELWTPIFAFLGVVFAALVSTVGKEFYSNWRSARKAASPVGVAEAEAVAAAVRLDREQWLDQQTRGLFETVHDQLERANREITTLRSEISGLRNEVGHLSLDLSKCHEERREAFDLVDAIRQQGGAR